jgi:hypothetical protein
MDQPGSTPISPPPRDTRSSRRRFPVSAWVVVALVACSLAASGAVALGNYVVARTTVSVSSVAWDIVVNGTPVQGYWISCQPWMPTVCPDKVSPDSTFNSTLPIYGSMFVGAELSLVVTGPFHLVSTTPSLPLTVPPQGLTLSYELALPSSAGQYDFLGTAVFT